MSTQHPAPNVDAAPGADEGGKKVTPLELFFDLVFVYAVTRASELLQEDHSWAGALRALVAFVPVFWTWAGTTIHANLHEIDTLRGRLEVFVVGGCGLVMAVALPEAYGERGCCSPAATGWRAW